MYSYNSSWTAQPPTNDLAREAEHRHLQRSSTAPTPSYPAPSFYPRVFVSEYVPPTIHRQDLFYINPNTSGTNSVPQSGFRSPPHVSAHPQYHAGPVPPPVPPPPGVRFRRSLTSPPPVPSKPSSWSSTPPTIPFNAHVPPPVLETVQHIPDPLTEDDELATALALSQSESHQQQQFLDKLSKEEEEDLARALEASMQPQSPMNPYTSTHSQSYTSHTGPSHPSVRTSADFSGPNPHRTWQEPSIVAQTLDDGNVSRSWSQSASSDYVGQMSNDEAFARRLVTEEEQERPLRKTSQDVNVCVETSPTSDPLDLPQYSPRRTPRPASSVLPTATSDTQDSDEVFARRLAAEDTAVERKQHDDGSPPIQAILPSVTPPPVTNTSYIPSYTDTRSPPSLSTSPEVPLIVGETTLVRNRSQGSVISAHSAHSDIVLPGPRSSSISVSRPTSADGLHSCPDNTFLMPSRQLSRPGSLPNLGEVSESEPNGSPPSPNINTNSSVINANNFVDADLLLGVSVGFTTPSITADLVPMPVAMPNIISLPYGRCPPLHLQASNWRHLLKLLARLSGSRLEPTLEAMAITKSDLKLRTVVQFVKPHHSSTDWRTILWFTIDHPVPPALPNHIKYTNGDVNVLPWSYTLSNLPGLLRDDADTQISKSYTIPATASVPYPALPITFPNLAMYLQAALEDSRRFIHDSSSGMRKLAKMVQTCYPTIYQDGLPHTQERSSVGGLFKRVIGRGNKSNKGRAGGGNEDTYELVTPFVPDEWGS